MDNQTQEQIEQHYNAMLDSVWLINSIVEGLAMVNNNLEDRKEVVKRNVAHLNLMLAKDFWTTQDMTPITIAITSGNNYANQ